MSANSFRNVLTSIPYVQCSQICTCFQCVPFVSIKNNDSAEEDFALLLLAEEEAEIPKKNRGTNKQTDKCC